MFTTHFQFVTPEGEESRELFGDLIDVSEQYVIRNQKECCDIRRTFSFTRVRSVCPEFSHEISL